MTRAIVSPATPPSRQEQREIAIYWDYENLQVPQWADPSSVSKAIIHSISGLGVIREKRLYHDFSCAPRAVWSQLDSMGFSLVNTPRRNSKETLDKKLIVDIMTYALDTLVRNDDSKPCIVLLTSDGDYAYTLSKLRDRGVMSVVMHGNDSSVAKVLQASADISMSFEHDVLKEGRTASSSPGFSSALVPVSVSSDSPQTVVSRNKKDRVAERTTLEDAKILCRAVSQWIAKGESTEAGWLLACKVGTDFRRGIEDTGTTNGLDVKERYKQARLFAVKNGWLLRGRRMLRGIEKGQIIIAPSDGSDKDRTQYSLDEFLRVTFQGKIEMGSPDDRNMPGNNKKALSSQCGLFVKNVPRSAHIKDLVRFLESEYGCIIVRGNTEKGIPGSPFHFARIQVKDLNDAKKLVALSKAGRLMMKDRDLYISYDTSKEPYSGDPNFYYERANEPSSADELLILCEVIHRIESNQPPGKERDWIDGGVIAVKFKEALKRKTGKVPDNDHFKIVRTTAVSRLLIESGRRVKTPTVGRVGQIQAATKSFNAFQYNPELYLRLTDNGRRYISAGSTDTSGYSLNVDGSYVLDKRPKNGCVVVVSGLPTGINVQDLVTFFEEIHDCTVLAAFIGAPDEIEKTEESSATALVDFMKHQDQARILNMAASSDGLIYEGSSLVAVPGDIDDLPEDGDDPLLFYRRPRRDSIPSTVSTTAHSLDSSSLSSPEAGTNGIEKDQSLCCVILYEMTSRFAVGDNQISSIPDRTSWQAAGSFAELFQNNVQCSSKIESSARFKNARADVVANGLVEMGRRKLEAEGIEIIVAPLFTGPVNPSGKKKLSNETYLRLTPKGVSVAMECLENQMFDDLTGFPPPKSVSLSASKNIFIKNLSIDTNVNDLVEYLNHAVGVAVSRACLETMHLDPNMASAHIECMSNKDGMAIIEASNDDGLIFNGWPLRMYEDRKVPNWNEYDPDVLYTSEDAEELEELTYSAEDNSISDSVVSAKEETFEETNLLEGDKIAMMYQQGLKAMSRETATTSSLKQALAVSLTPEPSSPEDSKVEIPDLLWD